MHACAGAADAAAQQPQQERQHAAAAAGAAGTALACCEVGIEHPLGAGAALPGLLPVAPVIIVFLAANGNHVGCHHVAHTCGAGQGGRGMGGGDRSKQWGCEEEEQ